MPVIEFRPTTRASGLTPTEVQAFIAKAQGLMDHGLSSGIEVVHTDDGATYVVIDGAAGNGSETLYIAFKERGDYFLLVPERRTPMVCSDHFEDLLAVIEMRAQ